MAKKYQVAAMYTTTALSRQFWEVEKFPEVSAKWWRINILSVTSTNAPTIDEIEFRSSIGVTDSDAGTAISSTSGADTANARDKTLGTSWVGSYSAAAGGTGWIGVEYAVAKTVKEVAFVVGTNVNRGPADFNVEYSHDGVVWNIASAIRGNTAPATITTYTAVSSKVTLIDNPTRPTGLDGYRSQKMAFSADGNWLVELINDAASNTTNRILLHKRSMSGWVLVHTLAISGVTMAGTSAWRVKVSKDASAIIFLDNGGSLLLFRRTGNVLSGPTTIATGVSVSYDISPDGNTIAYGPTSGNVVVTQYNGSTWSAVSFTSIASNAAGMCFSPNGKWLAIAGSASTVINIYSIAVGVITQVSTVSSVAATKRLFWKENRIVALKSSTSAAYYTFTVDDTTGVITYIATNTVASTTSYAMSYGALAPDAVLFYASTTNSYTVKGYVSAASGSDVPTAPSVMPSSYSTETTEIIASGFYYTGETSLYNQGWVDLIDRSLPLDNFKILLVSSDAEFNETHTTIDQVTNSGAYEVTVGTDVVTGGLVLSNAQFVVSGSSVTFTLDSTSFTNNTSSNVSLYGAVIYDDTTNTPLMFIDLQDLMTVFPGEVVNIAISSEGIAKFSK